MDTVAVTGAAGRVGGRVVEVLAEAGCPVRAVVRRPVETRPGVTAAVAAYTDRIALRAALTGVHTLVLVASDGEAELVLHHHFNVLAAAESAGVQHVVLLSSVDADLESPFCYARVNGLTEQSLGESGLPSTIIRASIYTEFMASLAGLVRNAGRLPLAAADGRVGLVSRIDVADCLAAAALRPPGGPIDVTGPAALHFDEFAAALGLSYQPVSDADFRRDLAGRESPWWSYAYASMFASIREHRWDITSDAVDRLTGRPPVSVRDLLRA